MRSPRRPRPHSDAAGISPQFAASTGLNVDCLRQQAQQPVSHDNLFHSVLGILDIQTQVYQPGLDLFRRCRGG